MCNGGFVNVFEAQYVYVIARSVFATKQSPFKWRLLRTKNQSVLATLAPHASAGVTCIIYYTGNSTDRKFKPQSTST